MTKREMILALAGPPDDAEILIDIRDEDDSGEEMFRLVKVETILADSANDTHGLLVGNAD